MNAGQPEHLDGVESEFSREVRRKSDRLRLARVRRGSAWRTLATVGTLGWMLALPILAGAMIGHVVGRITGRPVLALLTILLGLAGGCYTTWRYVRRTVGGGAVSWLTGSPWVAAGAGALLGLVGSGAHLWLTRWRAGLLARGRTLGILATMPLAIGPPLAAVGLAIQAGPVAMWMCIAGLVVGRWVFVRLLSEG